MPDFQVKITTPVELEGAKALAEQLERQIGRAKALGQAYDELEGKLKTVNSAIEGAGKGAKEGGLDEAIGGHHGIHAIGHALNDALPGLMQFTRFLTSGFTAAIGVAVLAYSYLSEKVEQFQKQVEDLATGPGARGEWAEKMADNVREAAVEEAVFNERLRETAERQNTLAEETERTIEAQKRQTAAARSVGEAQKELDLARLALREKLGQVSSDEAVRIRLEIDDAAFKRQLEAEKAAIQAELGARQQELAANDNREPALAAAKEQADAKALAAKNAQDKNEAKLAQEKEDLEKAKESLAKSEEILSKPHHWGDKADTFMRQQAEQNEETQQNTIGSLTTAINQQKSKQTALAEAAAVAKEQSEKAKSDYEEAAKLSAEVLKTVEKLKADLAAATAKNDALLSIHNQTSAANRTANDVELENRVRAGHGTPQENQQVADWNIQRSTSGERGPQAGLDAANTISAARTAAANMRGQTITPDQHAEIHGIIQEIIGFQANQSAEVRRQASALAETRRALENLQTSNVVNRTYN